MVRTSKKGQVEATREILFALGSMASAQSIVTNTAHDLHRCHEAQDEIGNAISALEHAVLNLRRAQEELQKGAK